MAVADSSEARKARGAFFTPAEVSKFIAEWAIRTPGDTVFEPSCGEASFLLAAADRLSVLGASSPLTGQLAGVELHEASASFAHQVLEESGACAEIRIGDFFESDFSSTYDCVVGNPPYVRYQDFAGAARTRAREAALVSGVRLSGLASSWAAFVVASTRLLSPAGRLGLVLPAELLSVNYAAPVRRFLMDRFRTVQLVAFEERVFPGVSEEVVLLLAEGSGTCDRIEVAQVENLSGLGSGPYLGWSPTNPEEKWTPSLINADALQAYVSLRAASAFNDLDDWGSTDLGMVTGNNEYFALARSAADKLGLRDDELIPISPPGSKHLRGLSFSSASWEAMEADGRQVLLFRPSSDDLSEAAARYIRRGQRRKVHTAYKCRVRKPWWRVPLVSRPDLFLTYMNHDAPRLVSNDAGVGYLNSIHGVFLKPDVREIGKQLLPVAMLNSLTLLGAELVGRSYGGGILKLEPREADRLPVPSKATLESAGDALRAIAPQLSSGLRNVELGSAIEMVDEVLLVGTLGLTRTRVSALRRARLQLFERRASRSATP